MRKTIKVETLLDMTNDFMEHSADDARQERLVVASFVSNILLKQGCYRGFGYLKPYSDPTNDPSRIFYYK